MLALASPSTTALDVDGQPNTIIIIPFPDVSHMVDSKQIARAIAIMNISQHHNLFIINTGDEKERIDELTTQNNYTMINIKDYSPFHNSIKHKLNERIRGIISDAPMGDRYRSAFQYFMDIYEPTVRGLDELFENHPKLSKIDHSKLFLVIDSIYNAAVEWTRKKEIRYLTISNSPILISHSYKPNIFPRMFYERTSLRRGREILEKEGIWSYLMNRLDEKLFRFVDFMRNMLPISIDLNQLRKSLGYEVVRGPFVDSSDRASISFSLPGYDYSTPLPMGCHLVGLTNTIIDKEKLNERDEIVDEWMNRDVNHIIYLSFGTKARLSVNHTCDFIRNIQSIDSKYHILLSERINTWSEFEKCSDMNGDDGSQPTNNNWKKQVLIRPWVNQAKVLSHPKVDLFISHGGAHSIYEAIENQVPILVFPQFAEQFLNSIRAEDLDIGRALYDPSDKLQFSQSFQELVTSSKFKKNLRRWHNINLAHTQPYAQIAQLYQISPNFLMTSTVIGNIIRNGDEHLFPAERKLLFIETLDIYQIIYTVCGLAICFAVILPRFFKR